MRKEFFKKEPVLLKPLFKLSRFSINTYGIFLKFFLQLNGGYWARIGFTQYRTENKIKKRNLYILPFYILLALLFGLLSFLYWYFLIAYVPIYIEYFLTDSLQWNETISGIIACAFFFGWLYTPVETK